MSRQHTETALYILVLALIISSHYLWYFHNLLHSPDNLNRVTQHGLDLSSPGLLSTVKPVIMIPEDSKRYQLDTREGIEQWKSLAPHDGLVGLPGNKTYGVAMFHQLKCLDILREEMLETTTIPPSRMSSHCLNYLRQMLLCQSPLQLESIRGNSPPKVAEFSRSQYVCRDWRAIYDEVAKLYGAQTL